MNHYVGDVRHGLPGSPASRSSSPSMAPTSRPTGDDVRQWFIAESLAGLASTIADGVDVRGCIHWTMIDNFEWFVGWRSHAGLFRDRPRDAASHRALEHRDL